MKLRLVWLTTLLFLITSPALAQSKTEQPPSGALLLTGARIVVRASEKPLVGFDVLIHDGRIVSVEKESERAGADVARDAQRIDLAGYTLAPGLIDLHTHLLLHPYDEASWNDQVLKERLALRTARATVAARRTLEAGFTTIRDLGTEGAGFADVGLRDAIEQSIIPGPRMMVVTRAIVASGAYGPSGFDPRWSMPVGAQVADGVTGVRKAVREQIAAGADWVKVYADYRRRSGGAITPTYSQEELDAIVDEAHSAGLDVSAHATTDEAIRRAVRAGVATIEHGYSASSDVLKLMRDQGVALCPTLAASEAMARYGGWTPGQPEPPSVLRARTLMKRALDAGVTIACGSDAGVFSHGDNVREIELMVEYGMSPAAALGAATFTAAIVLGRGDELGAIAPGFIADLIAVRGDPQRDVTTLRQPILVIKDGEVVIDRRRVRSPQ